MAEETKTKQKTLRGVITSDKMDKTVVVEVQRYVKHPKYKKFVKIKKKYKAHDETNAFVVGDKVEIKQVKPISKDKTFEVVTK